MNHIDNYPLYYATLSMAVVPCYETDPNRRCTCPQGCECSSPGKHPRTPHGLRDASTEVDQINAWGTHWPQANWAIATGATSGVDVLDIDPRHGGRETLAHLEEMYGSFPDTVTAITGSKGKHLFFLHQEGLRNSVGRLGPGLDVRGDGGYVIVAPSNHLSGGQYVWERDRAPSEIPFALWPASFLTLLMKPSIPSPSIAPRPTSSPITLPDSLLHWAARGAPLGQQANSAFWLACRLRQFGASEHAGWAVMESFAAACTPPADLRKVARIWHDSAKYQGYQPYRQLPALRRPSFTVLPEPRRPSVWSPTGGPS